MRRNLVSTGHRKGHVLGEILKVLDSLLYGVHSEAFDAEIRVRVALSVEPMFKHDCCSIQFLGC